MIDLHCHVLPGIDDGPATMEAALDVARTAVACGMRKLTATPHVSLRYPNRARTIAAGVADLNVRLAAAGIELDVVAGAELSIFAVEELGESELRRLRLGAGGWLLVESPYVLVADTFPMLVGGLQAQGHRIVLAHPERCPAFHRRPDLLDGMVRGQGVITSVTATALVGRFGRDVRRFALSMAARGLVHNVASDAHDRDRRGPGIADEMRRAGLGDQIELLTEAVPAAILSGGELPRLPDTLIRARPPRPWRRSPRTPG